MDWKKFAGPAILAGLAILIYQAVNVSGHMLYDEGDTVDDEFVLTSCCMGLLSILMCLVQSFGLRLHWERRRKRRFSCPKTLIISNMFRFLLRAMRRVRSCLPRLVEVVCNMHERNSSSQNLKAIRGKWLASSLLLVVL